ncbi:MAG: hypothetical protein B6I20_00790 [Bacteroidetes bacterium 4572_117]|nr:MAG: hypothetical protein B6I20_00790 [Bacteroidetes bacterium 4572_117]
MSRKFTLLVIEDDEASFKLIVAALKIFDLDILHAGNGRDGVTLFSENEIDLVLLDIQLPEMNGFEALSFLKKINSEIPIVAQTAYSMSGEKDKSIAMGCSDFLLKPIRIMEIRNLVSKYMTQ